MSGVRERGTPILRLWFNVDHGPCIFPQDLHPRHNVQLCKSGHMGERGRGSSELLRWISGSQTFISIYSPLIRVQHSQAVKPGVRKKRASEPTWQKQGLSSYMYPRMVMFHSSILQPRALISREEKWKGWIADVWSPITA